MKFFHMVNKLRVVMGIALCAEVLDFKFGVAKMFAKIYGNVIKFKI